MTLQDAIEKYHAGDITIKGLIHFYILIKGKPGWEIKIDFDYIKQILPVSKSSFYHAINCLKKEGTIVWKAIKGAVVSIITPQADNDISVPSESYTEPDSRIPDCQSEIPDCQSEIPDCQSEILDCQSGIPDYEPPKPATQSDCGDSPDLDQSLDQLLNNSLSNEQERESFIEFGKKKASELPKPPGLTLSWIKKHFTELFDIWQKQSGVITNQASNKWENHPQKEEWLNKIRTIGFGAFIVENGFDEQRKAFFVWASASNIIWEAKS
ncbi:hypothetical protein [Scytonema hofmannii]|nr:hypothetical protein [Scytonema hofmannii]